MNLPNKDNLNNTLWKRFLPSSIRSGLLFGALALVSWFSGLPLLWPSIGPTAYILVFDQDKNHPFVSVFGAHTIGVLTGLLAHQIFIAQFMPATSHSLESTGINIAMSAILALSLTTGAMRATGWTHSPACATTLIIALGLMADPLEVLFILVAVILIYGVHLINERLFEKIGWIG